MNQAIENASLYFMNQGKYKIDAQYTPDKGVYLAHMKRDLIASINDQTNMKMTNIINAHILSRCIELIGPLSSWTVVAEDTFNDQSKIGYHLKTLCDQIGEITSAIDELDTLGSVKCIEAAKLIRLHCDQATIHGNMLINTVRDLQAQCSGVECMTLTMSVQNITSVLDMVVALREACRIYLQKVAKNALNKEGV